MKSRNGPGSRWRALILAQTLGQLTRIYFAQADDEVFDIRNAVERMPCPEGTEWHTTYEIFQPSNGFHEDFNYDANPETVNSAITDFTTKNLRMSVFPGLGNNDTAYVSTHEWKAPVVAQVNIIATGAPGIPSTFNFRRNGVTGWKEIDFIIASRQADDGKLKHFMSVPLYKPDGDKLRLLSVSGQDREVSVAITKPATAFTIDNNKFEAVDGSAQDAVFQQNWAITWEDYKPEESNTYVIEWLPDKISWHAGPRYKPTLRVTLTKEKDNDSFPKGPFPLRFGPWESSGHWAGIVDWPNYRNPSMYIDNLNITGCRVIPG